MLEFFIWFYAISVVSAGIGVTINYNEIRLVLSKNKPHFILHTRVLFSMLVVVLTPLLNTFVATVDVLKFIVLLIRRKET